MNLWSLLAMLGVAVAVFLLGALSGWVWHRRKGTDDTAELTRRINVGLSAFFTLVALMVAIDVIALTVKFNRYVEETLPRDKAQEDCNTATIDVLTSWIESRSYRDHAMDDRDDAAMVVLNGIIAGEPANTEDVAAWRDAVAADRKVRAEAAAQRVPLPKC